MSERNREIIIMVDHSGSGKSTLVKAIRRITF